MKQAILCGKLLNTVKKRVDTDQVILVEDDRIQAVERREAIEIPEGYEIVDCSDRFVTPGLIDAHLHTAFDPTTYLKDYTGDGVIFRHVSHIVVETPESFPWALDGEYGPGEERVEINNLHQKLTFLL